MNERDEDHVPMPADEAGARRVWVLFLAGPTIWFGHFLLVYVAAEVMCKPLDTGVVIARLPLVSFLTVVATVAAAGAVAVASTLSFRRWQTSRDAAPEHDEAGGRESALLFGGVLLGVLFFLAVIFTGAPALWLRPC